MLKEQKKTSRKILSLIHRIIELAILQVTN